FFRVSLGHESLEDEDYTDRLHLSFFTGCPIRLRWIIGQVLLGLIFIIAGAHVFVEYLTVFSIKTGISSLVLSLLLTPVATELPEKFNSITWTIKGKDTIAIGNLTGAMVFQSTIPVAIGLSFTNWQLEATEYINIASTIVMSLILLFSLKENGRLPFWALLMGGGFYAFYILRVFVI
ncbi:MAG: sodium:calcium antiporter, partial [Nitrospirae bacterium]